MRQIVAVFVDKANFFLYYPQQLNEVDELLLYRNQSMGEGMRPATVKNQE
jgi:hypothetical protein